MATTKLDHLDHLFVEFIYLYTPRFRYPKTEETIKEGSTV
jgi:DNA polymerase sigma